MIPGYDSEFFFLRTPLLALHHLQSLYECDSIHFENSYLKYLSRYLEDEVYLEALYIASPDLHNQIVRYKNGQLYRSKDIKKLEEALLEYHLRMSFRCTPFGIFAGCSVGNYNTTTGISFHSRPLERHVRLDMDFLSQVYYKLMKSPEVYKVIAYTTNKSLYRVGAQYRYTEYRTSDSGRRTHHLVSLEPNAILNAIIRVAKAPKSYAQLLSIIESGGFERQESENFLNDLIQSQVLTSEIEPNVTGTNYLKRLIAVLDRHSIDTDTVHLLRNIYDKICTYDFSKNNLQFYKEIYKSAKCIIETVPEKRVFQVDLTKKTVECSLNKNLKTELLNVISVVKKLNPSHDHLKPIHYFKNAFYERYESRTVALTEVMDSDIGLGYKNARSTSDFYRWDTADNIDQFASFKLQKFHEWLRLGSDTVEITDADVEKYGQNNAQMPDSFSIMFSVLSNGDTPSIVLKGTSGPSGVNLLGRFAHSSQHLQSELRNLCKLEEQHHPDKVYAEIIHIPQDRVGNVLARPVLRNYEIPYLAYSTLNGTHQITIDDLYVKYVDGRIVLFSKRLKKEVIPRLSTAHNFSLGLPTYNFLCDLQFQQVQGNVYWDWSILRRQAHLPRVTYKNFILSPQMWNINRNDCSVGTGRRTSELNFSDFPEIRTKFRLPDYVVLCESDNQIVLNLKTAFCVNYLIKKINKQGYVLLQEFLWSFDSGLIREGHGILTNEFIIPFVKNVHQGAVVRGKLLNQPLHRISNIQRKFIPGSQWLYCKIYLSPKQSNATLVKYIFSFLARAKKLGQIDNWFFIRYQDPKHHIRIRLHFTDSTKFHTVLNELYQVGHSLIEAGTIWNLQLDTYVREVERYSTVGIEFAEELFCLNSEYTYSILKLLKDEEDELMYMYSSFVGINALFDALEYGIHERIAFCKMSADSFIYARKVTNSKGLKETMSCFYRAHSKDIISFFRGLTIGDGLQKPKLDKLEQVTSKYRKQLKQKFQKCSVDDKDLLDSFARDFIHMYVNRLFRTYRGDREYQIYGHLFKLYTSMKLHNYENPSNSKSRAR